MGSYIRNVFRNVKSPLTTEQLDSIDQECERVQFIHTELAPEDIPLLAEFLSDKPYLRLRIYGHQPLEDLDFLRYFPFLQQFSVDVWGLSSFAGLENLTGLKSLGIGDTKSTRHSLSVLEEFHKLEDLYLEGQKKHLESIGKLTSLQKLDLRSITLPDLEILLPLEKLWWFTIKLGGTKNIGLLPEIGNLKYLEIWRVRGFDDLSAISDIPSLQYLFLQTLNRVIALPSFRKLTDLRRVHLETLKRLSDLSALLEASALTELVIMNMPQLIPEDFQPIIAHPTLKNISVFLRSTRKNKEISNLFKLPLVEGGKFGFDFE